jgi:hypothetical protein
MDSKSIILHEETEVNLKQRETPEKSSFLQELTEGVRYRISQRTNTLIEKLEKSKRERNLRTVISLPKVLERVSTN